MPRRVGPGECWSQPIVIRIDRRCGEYRFATRLPLPDSPGRVPVIDLPPGPGCQRSFFPMDRRTQFEVDPCGPAVHSRGNVGGAAEANRTYIVLLVSTSLADCLTVNIGLAVRSLTMTGRLSNRDGFLRPQFDEATSGTVRMEGDRSTFFLRRWS